MSRILHLVEQIVEGALWGCWKGSAIWWAGFRLEYRSFCDHDFCRKKWCYIVICMLLQSIYLMLTKSGVVP